MGNRCAECNKFVSVDLSDEAEIENTEVEAVDDKKGILRVTATLTKICAECGTELFTKEITIEAEIDLTGFEEA